MNTLLSFADAYTSQDSNLAGLISHPCFDKHNCFLLYKPASPAPVYFILHKMSSNDCQNIYNTSCFIKKVVFVRLHMCVYAPERSLIAYLQAQLQVPFLIISHHAASLFSNTSGPLLPSQLAGYLPRPMLILHCQGRLEVKDSTKPADFHPHEPEFIGKKDP